MHETYMRRCFQLALKGMGQVAPNPMVGCVIVRDGVVIGEGFHRKIGESHAEINAIESVENNDLLNGASLYVNLEPCVHHGKTPPCADRIIESGISKVFISASDPNEKVAGKGIEKLRSHGINVLTDLLRESELDLNRRFRTFHEKKRPYVILKWAQSRDGFMDIDRKNQEKGQFRISNDESRRILHKWRSEEGSILVGTNTVGNDDPSLDVRYVEGNDPLRLVIDLKMRLPKDLKVFEDGKKTILYSELSGSRGPNVEIVTVQTSKGVLHQILDDLYKRGIQSLIVEGGKNVLKSFVDLNLWDEARVFVSPVELKNGLRAIDFATPILRSENMGDNTCIFYRNNS